MKDERVEEEGNLHLQGIDIDQLLDMNNEQLVELFVCRIRRKFSRGLKRKPRALIKSCGRIRKRLPPMKPEVVEIHLKKMVIVPEMIGTIVGFHNGKVFTQVEVKSEMIGHYLDEFSNSSKQQIKDKPHMTIKAPCLFKPEYPLDSNSSSLSYDNSPQTLHLLLKFQFLVSQLKLSWPPSVGRGERRMTMSFV